MILGLFSALHVFPNHIVSISAWTEYMFNRISIPLYCGSEHITCVSQLTASIYRQINVLPQDRYLQEFYGILF